jgi:taurine dioxygenase
MDIRPLHPQFGAEVMNFDVQLGSAPEDIAALRQAFDQYSLLLFRGGRRISPDRHTEIATWFGPPGPVSNSGADDFVSVLHNRDPAGSMQLPFHCDLTYTDVPIKAICLHAIDLPASPTSTTFVSNKAAWQRLTPSQQTRLEALTLRHVHISNVQEYDWPPFIADHKVKFTHPRTGEPLLLVTEHHAEKILELNDSESRALIDELLAHIYANECQYDHIWQLDDLLLWDNLAVQHARREQSDYVGGPRALQRVALAEVGLPELIERARSMQNQVP